MPLYWCECSETLRNSRCVFLRRESCNAGEGDPPLYVNVNMFSGEIINTWIDSLQAFFPGLQVGFQNCFNQVMVMMVR